eukprot:TRINITY_DN4148_c0_g1_i1.p1 TRINITY_DN4148_c0_g1~~TRINITY_DN4148_c0_g1_i1.p1  ORF type:complete len:548 (+),score=139.82 TRINITY_DN4148_c0_g1_i1:161-1804(+)
MASKESTVSLDQITVNLRDSQITPEDEKEAIVQPCRVPAMKVELGTAAGLEDPQFSLPEDLYERNFYLTRHFNYIGVTANAKEEEEIVVVSVKAVPQDGEYRALKNTKKGFEEFSIAESAIEKDKSSKTPTGTGAATKLLTVVEKQLLKYLNNTFQNTRFRTVKDTKFYEDLLQIEKKHPQDNKRCLKVAVIYSKANQKSPHEMFQNKSSADFQDFLSILGEKIQLLGWTGYRGDLNTGQEAETIYTKWKGFEVMYHVSTMTNSEQHRRLIGNDIGAIIFQEETPLDPTHLNLLGTVPQVFAVVQPQKVTEKGKTQTLYRLAFVTGVNVKPYPPELPRKYLFTKANLKDFLLTKLANGYIKALSCPPMNRLFYIPRAASLVDLAKKYPQESDKDQKLRQAQESELRKSYSEFPTNLNIPKKTELTVRVIGGRNLASKDLNGYSDPYCIVSVKDTKFKTDIKKKTLNPTWLEEFTFELWGTDVSWSDFELTCMDWDRFGGHDFMGHIIIPLSDIKQYVDQETWFALQTNENNEFVSGEIQLKFSVTTD